MLKNADRYAMAFAVICGVGSTASIGFEAGQTIERQRAIEAGVAQWEVDPVTGETEFVYLGKESDNAE